VEECEVGWGWVIVSWVSGEASWGMENILTMDLLLGTLYYDVHT